MRAVPGLGRPGFLRKRVAGALREAPGRENQDFCAILCSATALLQRRAHVGAVGATILKI